MTATCVSFGPISRPSVTLMTNSLINSKLCSLMLPDESRRKTRSIPLIRQARVKKRARLSTSVLIMDHKVFLI